MSQDLNKYVRSPTTNSDLRLYLNNELAKIQAATDTFFKMLGDLNMLAGTVEGEFLPVVKGTTTAGVGTYTTQVGRYLKIGRCVLFSFRVDWSAHTGTGNMVLSGLPYVATAKFAASVFFTAPGAGIPATDVMVVNASAAEIQVATAGFAANQAMVAGGSLIVTGLYFTDT
jgi:hypothetical protein